MLGWATGKIHISWAFAWLSIGVLAGVAIAGQWSTARFANSFWFILAVAIVLPAFVKNWRILMALPLVAGILIGLWRAAPQQIDKLIYDKIIGEEVELSGGVAKDVSEGRGWQGLQLDDVKIDGHALSGQVWASIGSRTEIKRSDHVVLVGELREGFGNFAASMWLADLAEVQRIPMADVGLQVRDSFNSQVLAHVDEPQASLAIGFVTGTTTTLPPGLYEDLRTLGLIHIVVASGYHLTIVAGTLRRRLTKVSKYLAVLVSGLVFAAFLMITGYGTSMIRAVLVGGLGLLGWYYGRRLHPFVLLPVAAAITVLINPGFLWGDLGWYLSFAAFAGVIVLAPLLNAYFFADRGQGTLLRHILLATVAAQAFTFPIIALGFGQYSVYALLANLLVVPLIPLAMLLTFFVGLTAYFSDWLADMLAYPTEWLIGYMVWVSERMAAWPYAEGAVQVTMFGVAAAYALLAVVIFILKRKTNYNLRGENITY